MNRRAQCRTACVCDLRAVRLPRGWTLMFLFLSCVRRHLGPSLLIVPTESGDDFEVKGLIATSKAHVWCLSSLQVPYRCHPPFGELVHTGPRIIATSGRSGDAMVRVGGFRLAQVCRTVSFGRFCDTIRWRAGLFAVGSRAPARVKFATNGQETANARRSLS